MTKEQQAAFRAGLGAFDALVDRLTMLRLVLKDHCPVQDSEGVDLAFVGGTIPVFAQAMKDMHDGAVPMCAAVEACTSLIPVPASSSTLN